jgi:hypothetical protein
MSAVSAAARHRMVAVNPETGEREQIMAWT